MPETRERCLYITVAREVVPVLAELGRREQRNTRQQAAALVLEGLRRRGLLSDEADTVEGEYTPVVGGALHG